MIVRAILIALATFAGLARAQAGLSFEVGSVKPSGPKSVRGSQRGPGSADPGRYSFAAATLQDLIAIA